MNYVSQHALGLVQFEDTISRCIVDEPCLLACMDLVRFELNHSPEVSFGVTSSSCLLGYTHGLLVVREVHN